ncbi:hypothetical protein BLGI_2766 [Brevibacillus laterosporus GI-9]|nr:hypothetical protein BLGI_2766 [Brevibacillus laterosporus GI-9]
MGVFFYLLLLSPKMGIIINTKASTYQKIQGECLFKMLMGNRMSPLI